MKKIILIFFILTIIFNEFIFPQTWKSYTSENSGLSDNMVNSIAVCNDGTIWFATNNGLCAYDTTIWKVYNIEDGLKNNKINSISFLSSNSQELWVASDSGITILTVNKTEIITSPKYINKISNNIISNKVRSIEVDGFANNWIGTEDGLSIITNSGIYSFNESNGFEKPKVNALKSLSDNWVHVGTSGGGVNRLKYNGVDGITSASNIITTWSGLASDTVLAIYVTDDTLRWYGTTQGVSTHFGTDTKNIDNWWIYNSYTSEIVENYVRAIIRDNNGAMWFGTRKGISKMVSDKTTWETFTETDGLISNNIYDIEIDKKNNLWIATDKGVSYFTNIPTSVKNISEKTYKLNLSNYPNPFNPTTKISYSIPNLTSSLSSSKNVKITIYDVLGKMVKILVNENQKPGNYEIEFNAENLASGIYYYSLRADNIIETRKMILIK
ncbi:MAG: two-component regulator propeller domain-containing protein [Melioribacteraceae bacterium]